MEGFKWHEIAPETPAGMPGVRIHWVRPDEPHAIKNTGPAPKKLIRCVRAKP